MNKKSAPKRAAALEDASTSAAPQADAVVTIHANRVLESNYLGIGVQWEPYEVVLSEKDWERIYARLDYMKPPVVRLMLAADWYCTGFDKSGNPTYDWDSSGMQELYRELDYLQSRDITVIIGEWHDPFITSLAHLNIHETDTRWARLIADFLHQIHNVRGYEMVKYYNLINEPNGHWSGNKDWTSWMTAINNLHSMLSSRRYLDRIQIIGPDTTDADSWLNMAVDNLQDKIGLYDIHRYATLKDVESGAFEVQMSALKNYILEHDPKGAAKRLFLNESGIIDGKNQALDTQPLRYDFVYGVWMADYLIQSIRAGLAGSMAWDLDDAMHTHNPGYGSLNLKGWGFWNSVGGQYGYPAKDLELRPWFYTWSLMSRNFPRGSQTLVCDVTGIEGLRVAAAKVPNGSKYDLTFAVVNDYDTARSVQLVVPEAGAAVTLGQFNYFSDDRPVDENGFPVKKTILNGVDLKKGLVVNLPSRGVLILTTREGGSAIPLSTGG
jgi:hypothetical protein